MVGWLLLTSASALGCPWADHVVVCRSRWVTVVETCEPVVQWVEPARDCAPVRVAPQKNPEPSALVAPVADELAAVSDIVTEPAAFAFPGSSLLTSTALDWGVATIGPGTLYPNWGMPGGGGGMFWPRGNDSSGSSSTTTPGANPGATVPPPTSSGQNPVPEPVSVFLWMLGLGWLAARRCRGAALARLRR